MTETEKLKEQLYERMQQENESFMTEVKAMSVDGIIGCAYEITYRDNILMLFEDETMLSPRQLKVLLGFEHPLSVLYRDWCNRDTDLMDTLRSCVQSCADDILHEQAAEKYSNPQTSVYAKSLTEARISGEYYEW